MNPRIATPVVLSLVALAMLGGAFASEPLYNTFCRVTGYGGTTRRATSGADEVLDRVVTVRFDANTARGAPIAFTPAQREIDVRLGENAIAYFRAANLTSEPVTMTASFNVAPFKAGPYFKKIQCFCFTEQRLEPGEHAEMPVVFFVDPAMADEARLDDVRTITLSYTMYRSVDGLPDQAAANRPVAGDGDQG